jgi:hypothetical protein
MQTLETSSFFNTPFSNYNCHPRSLWTSEWNITALAPRYLGITPLLRFEMAATTNLAIQKAGSSASSERRLPQYRVLMGIVNTLNLNLTSGS